MKIYHAINLMEAKIVQDQLKLAGIPSEIRNIQATTLRGILPMTVETLPTLFLVNAEDKERALKIIAEHDSHSKESSRPWLCPHCQEENPETFAICWNCQKTPDEAIDKDAKNLINTQKTIQENKNRLWLWITLLMLGIVLWILLTGNN